MKALFLTAAKESPSAKWRVLQFIPHFEKAGLACTVEELPSGMLARLSLAGRMDAFDLVFLQKRLMPKLLINRFRKHSKVLVFEYDDGVTVKRTEEGAVADSPTRERRFKRVVKLADAVITTNESLAEVARRGAERPEKVHVLPTVIDLARWEPRAHEPTQDPVIGWMGTVSNLVSMEILKQPLARLCRRYDRLRVRIVCDGSVAMEGVRLEHKRFSPEEEVADIRSFDVAVAPLVEDPWTRGKLSTKVLAYSAAGLPIVASDVTANRLYLRDGENGFLVGTLSQWEERLSKLIEDAELRVSTGRRAREVVEKEYSIASAVPRYLALFESLTSARK